MKIAVACDRPELVGLVSARFGRSAWFLVHDTRGGRFAIVRHGGAASDAGIRAARLLVRARVGAVVAGDFGESVVRVLHDAHVCLFRAGHVTAATALAAFQQGRLTDL